LTGVTQVKQTKSVRGDTKKRVRSPDSRFSAQGRAENKKKLNVALLQILTPATILKKIASRKEMALKKRNVQWRFNDTFAGACTEVQQCWSRTAKPYILEHWSPGVNGSVGTAAMCTAAV
jgi:hypothetical protein